MDSFDFICVEDYAVFEGHIDDELLEEIMSE